MAIKIETLTDHPFTKLSLKNAGSKLAARLFNAFPR
jgi:hypothetical protein